jgi:hypothetical protein
MISLNDDRTCRVSRDVRGFETRIPFALEAVTGIRDLHGQRPYKKSNPVNISLYSKDKYPRKVNCHKTIKKLNR